MTRIAKITRRAELWQRNRRPRRAAQLADDVPYLLDRIEHLEAERWAALTVRETNRTVTS